MAPLSSEARRPRNDLALQELKGASRPAIHDAGVAKAAGLKDAPIHGTTHMTQFQPLLHKRFGNREWEETGALALLFHEPVAHREPVVAYVGDKIEGAAHVPVWMERVRDGTRVLSGTASVGRLDPNVRDDSAVRRALAKAIARPSPSVPLAIVRVQVGETSVRESGVALRFDGANIGPLFPYAYRDKLTRLTEPHPWFTREGGRASPWGRPVLPLEMHNVLMSYTLDRVQWSGGGVLDTRAVSLFGACEVRSLNGPLHPDLSYELQRAVVAVGESRGVEYVWLHTSLFGGGCVVADMVLQLLFLKRTFPGYDRRRQRLSRL